MKTYKLYLDIAGNLALFAAELDESNTPEPADEGND